tara:strand:+ start:744 stop:1145 length:402 start_codon:yes stop_codon:yes gene_type:complete
MSYLDDALDLMMYSDIHRKWSVGDLHRLIIPPISLGQFGFLRTGGKPVSLLTWAWLTKEAEKGYIEGTRKIQPKDWDAGDELWVVDFIAPFGRVREAVAYFKQFEFLHKAKFRRSHSPKVVRAKGRLVNGRRG